MGGIARHAFNAQAGWYRLIMTVLTALCLAARMSMHSMGL